jgi:hypothetical protein
MTRRRGLSYHQTVSLAPEGCLIALACVGSRRRQGLIIFFFS